MRKWIIKNTRADLAQISQSLKVNKLICKIISNRGITTTEGMRRFLWDEKNSLYGPEKLRDMDKVVKMLTDAIDHKKKIRVIGDYDQDGISSTYILKRGLDKLGATVDYDTPERSKDGYGINKRLIDRAIESGVHVILTCDNGIAAKKEIAYAKENGLMVIITDHHDIPYIEIEGKKVYDMPLADAIVNPKRADCHYPFKDICGATVAFKVIEALYREFGLAEDRLEEFYEFVAMATVCDVMDLVDENRILVKEGLKRINSTSNLGLRSLIEQTGLSHKEIGTYHLGFIIGPCINASGRLETARTAIDMFLTDKEEEARQKARLLFELNEERKELTKKGLESLLENIEREGHSEDKVLVLYDKTIHESIAGIIAGRIKEEYNRPVIVLTSSDKRGIAKGSGRSIGAYNMFEELSKHKHLFLKFGGHPMAAGLSLEESKIGELRDILNRETYLTEEDFIPRVDLDAQIPIEKVGKSLPEMLAILEPFGKGNSKPLFGDRGIGVEKIDILGKNYRIMKFSMKKNGVRNIEGIYFGNLEDMEAYIRGKFGDEEYEKARSGIENGVRLDMVYYPTINEYRGDKKLQIVIQDYR